VLGYLLREGDKAVLMDCGPAHPAASIAPAVNRLGGVAISHLHPDH